MAAMVDFATFLSRALSEQLPGWEAQQRMMPRYRDGSHRVFSPPPDARQSAVAVVISGGQRPSVLLTLRSAQLRHHRGQISFPGGRIESGETPRDAALRELREEVGIEPTLVVVLGSLTSLYTPPSNSAIVPIVMSCAYPLECRLDAAEVEESFWVELAALSDTAIEEEWELPYGRMIVPHWRIHRRVPLWGATAMILSELLALYRRWIMQPESLSRPVAAALHRNEHAHRSAN